MSTPVHYNPSASYTAGKTLIQITPAIATLASMKLSEANAATAVQIQCATNAFESTTDVSTVTRRMLCDTVATESPGARKYGMSSLTIMMGDPQSATNAALDKLTLDSVVYLVMRPGITADKTSSTAWAASQRYMAIKAKVTAVDLKPITAEDGDEYAAVVSFAVQERTQLFGTVVTG